MKILWLEDNPDEIGSMLSLLREGDIQVDQVSDTASVQAKLEREKYDIVVLDGRIEGEGAEAGANLYMSLEESWKGRKDRPGVIFATGYEAEIRGFLRANDLEEPPATIGKPVDVSEGVAAILGADPRAEYERFEMGECLGCHLEIAVPERIEVGRNMCVSLTFERELPSQDDVYLTAQVALAGGEDVSASEILLPTDTEHSTKTFFLRAGEAGQQLIDVQLFGPGGRVGHFGVDVEVADCDDQDL